MKKSIILVLVLTFITFTICSVNFAGACSVMMKTNSQGTFVGRTLEWWGTGSKQDSNHSKGFYGS